MNATRDDIEFTPFCQAQKWEREIERTIPTIDGQLVAPQFVPEHRRADYAEKLAAWCREHRERPQWLAHCIAIGSVKP